MLPSAPALCCHQLCSGEMAAAPGSRQGVEILRIEGALAPADLAELSDLLVDAVDGGASVGFLSPMERGTALGYWQRVSDTLTAGDGLSLWVAAEAGAQGAAIGTVQVELCGKENGLHRAELQKLLVHSSQRRTGVGAALIAIAEEHAAASGRSLLILDTQAGSAAESVYQRCGWQRAAEIPSFAASPDGELHATVFYYKRLRAPTAGGAAL